MGNVCSRREPMAKRKAEEASGAEAKRKPDEETEAEDQVPEMRELKQKWKLYEADQKFEITVTKDASEALGIQVTRLLQSKKLKIEKVEDGPFLRWNVDHPSQQIIEDDCIIAVNGTGDDPQLLLDMMMQATTFNVTFIRSNPVESHMYSVPVMTADEMQKMTVPLSEAPDKLEAMLKEYGLAIVTDVISQTEIAEFEDKFKQDLLELVDKDKVDEASESVQAAYSRFVNEGVSRFPLRTARSITESAGFALERCLPHGRFAWAVRRHPNVHAAFSAAFCGEKDFVTSVDVPFFAPSGQMPKNRVDFSAHVDQNLHDCRPGLKDCEVYQGVLYVWSAEDEHSSTTAAWPGSHREPYEEMMKDDSYKAAGRGGMHYSPVSEMRARSSAKALAAGWARHARRIPVPAGALLLWNSRTMHTGWQGGPRLAQAVCLEPRSRRAEVEKISKMRLAALGLPSVHWASIAMQHDMVIGYEGFLDTGKRPAAPRIADPAVDPDEVQLPLKAAIRPVGLVEDANLDELQDLVEKGKFKMIGLWCPPPEAAALLKGKVTEDVESFL